MNIKIQGGGKGVYSNAGSCIGVTTYLQHEETDRERSSEIKEPFFTHDKAEVSASEVTYKIDHNKGQLHKSDSKFFVITVSPSKDEVRAMGNTPEERSVNFKEYINKGVMQVYAFNFSKGLKREDLMYYAKVHHTRGDNKEDQLHAHIIVSRKDISNKMKLSPQTNHRGNSKGAVKSGFDRTNFFKLCEEVFDLGFKYKRSYQDTFEYQNTLKNGTSKDLVKLVEGKKEFYRNQQEVFDKQDLEIQQEQTQTRGRRM